MMEQLEAKTGVTVTYYRAKADEGKLDVLLELLAEVADKEEFYRQVAAIMQEQGVQLGKVYIMKRGYHLAQYEAMMTNGRTIQTMKLPVPIEGEPEEEYVVEIVEA